MVHAKFVNQPVDVLCGDAGSDVVAQHIEALGREPARLSHALKGTGAVDLDLSGFTQRRDGRVNIGHGVGASGSDKSG